MTDGHEVIRARLSLSGIGLWRCGRCRTDHDASTSWIEVPDDGRSSQDTVAQVLCPDCAGVDGGGVERTGRDT